MRSWSLISGAVGAIVGYLYGGWSPVLDLLLLAVLIDYITGLAAASKEGQLSSKVGFSGIVKKVVIFLIVALAAKVGSVFGMGETLKMATAIGYIVNELLSVAENAGRLGVHVPAVFQKAIASLKQKGDGSL